MIDEHVDQRLWSELLTGRRRIAYLDICKVADAYWGELWTCVKIAVPASLTLRPLLWRLVQ
jgi:hypothetical protein